MYRPNLRAADGRCGGQSRREPAGGVGAAGLDLIMVVWLYYSSCGKSPVWASSILPPTSSDLTLGDFRSLAQRAVYLERNQSGLARPFLDPVWLHLGEARSFAFLSTDMGHILLIYYRFP
jgi:hypothetical protein